MRSVLFALLLGAAAAARAGGTLTVCTEAAPDGFDIAQSMSGVTHDAVGKTIFEQLVTYRRGTAELAPGLAERWDVSADGLRYTFSLRRGVTFHTTPWFTPTRALNADDVMFSFGRLMDVRGPWQAIAHNGYGMWNDLGLAATVQSVDKLDELHVRFTLRRPSAPFLNNLASTFAGSVFSAEYAAQLQRAGTLERLNTQPVGTGPFALRSQQKDAVIRLVPHQGYWGGASTLDALVFAITPDPNVRLQRLKSGECLLGNNLKAETLDSLANTPVKVLATTALLTSYVAINTRKPALGDKRLRLALWLALDKKSMVASVYGGKAQNADSFLPPAQWSHDATLARGTDVAAARALVQAAGYDGRELVIITRIGGSIDARRAAELMQADWARIGVRTRVQMMEWGELLKRTSRGEHDITFFSWSGGGDPDGFFAPNLSCAAIAGGGNASLWCDPTFDALLAAASRASERAERQALYVKAQRRVFDEVPVIPLVYPQYFIGLHPQVRGFIASPLSDLDFRNVSLP